jgi:hypothetical protein
MLSLCKVFAPTPPSPAPWRGAVGRGIRAAANAAGKPAAEIPADAQAIAALRTAAIDRQAVWATRRAIETAASVPANVLRAASDVARKSEPTLADVATAVEACGWEDRKRIARGLVFLARFIGRELDEIPARLADLDDELKQMKEGHFRVGSPKTAKVMRSRVRAAIRLLDRTGRRRLSPLTGRWAIIGGALEAANTSGSLPGSVRGELLPFFAFCSEKSITLDKAQHGVEVWAEQFKQKKTPRWRKKVSRLVHRWNALAGSDLVAGFPMTRLVAPSHTLPRVTRPLNPDLQRSWKDWVRRHTPARTATALLDELFAPLGPAADPTRSVSALSENLDAPYEEPRRRRRRRFLSPSYLDSLEWLLRFTYACCVDAGAPESSLDSVKSVLDYAGFLIVLKAIIKRAEAKDVAAGRAFRLTPSTMTAVAKLITLAHGAGVSRADLERIHAAAGELREHVGTDGPRGGCQMGERHRGMLRQFEDPQRILDWYLRPARIYERVLRELGAFANGRIQPALIDRSKIRKQHCAAIEAAVVMAIEQNMPLRRRNVGKIRRKGEHPNLSMPLRAGEPAHLRFGAAETKNLVNIATPLDPEAVHLIQLWVDVFIPWKIAHQHVDPANVFLFPARGVEHKNLNNLRQNVHNEYSRVGLDLDLHIHRALAGKIILMAKPLEFELVARLLGHTNAETARKFYAEEVDPYIIHATWSAILRGEIERLRHKQLLIEGA